jgi:exosortase/archaeosortase family protein
MIRLMNHPLWVLVLAALACWDAWRWYGGRIAPAPEEAAALLLTTGLVVALGWRHSGGSPRWQAIPVLPLAILLAVYALSYGWAPPIIRAALAAIIVLVPLYRTLIGTWPPIALYGLIALSLPVLPSLQFVLGYPMRVISAAMSVALLNMQGLAVSRQGTFLHWAGETVQFDAPCSGVTMMWASFMLTLAACVVWRSGWRMTLLALGASLALTIAANVLRATSLFYLETGLITGAAPWWHDAIGLIAFAFSAAAILKVLQFLRVQEVR